MAQAYWSAATLGIDTPAWRQTYWVSPEQSNEFGPVPPHRYGLPSSEKAQASATGVVAKGRGIGTLRVELERRRRHQLLARLIGQGHVGGRHVGRRCPDDRRQLVLELLRLGLLRGERLLGVGFLLGGLLLGRLG